MFVASMASIVVVVGASVVVAVVVVVVVVDVPDRPTYLSPNEMAKIQKNLESNRNAAIEAAKQDPET